MQQRLESLDVLRGFDLWLLLFVGPISYSYCDVNDGGLLRDFLTHYCDHVPWNGFVLWDIIMPLFMFMSGITIPFSMAKYRKDEKPGRAFWLRLLRRFVLLWLLGMVVQGNLLTLQWNQLHPFANTLQAIAVAYVAAAITYVYGGVRCQIVVSVVCFVTYFLCFSLSGQLTPDFQDNIAMWIDKWFLGSHRDGVIWATDGKWSYDSDYCYTWILSSLDFIVTGIMGSLVGHVLRNSKAVPTRRALYLLVTGVILVVAGLLLGEVFAINKKLWNSSMTLYSGGICTLMMAFSYYVIDVCGWKIGLNWLKFYGMNSIVAYCLGESVNFSSVSKSFLYGFEPILGDYYNVLIALANAMILFLILRTLYKQSIFFKV